MRSYLSWFLCVVVAMHVGILLRQGATRFATVDEVGHLPAGLEHWRFGRFEMYRVNPPLVRLVAALPAWLAQTDYDWAHYEREIRFRAEFTVGQRKLAEHGVKLIDAYVLPRWFAISFSLLAMLTLWHWGVPSRERLPCTVAISWWCTSPIVLAHAATIGPDIGSVAFGLLSCMMAWQYVHVPSTRSAVSAGLALGLALLTKLTWLTTVLSLPLTGLICLFVLRRRLPQRPLKKRGLDLVLAWLVALLTLNAGYLFEGSCKPLGSYDFCSEALGGEGCSPGERDNRFRGTWLGKIPIAVPRNYLLGIDYLKYEVEQKKWSFLMAEWKFGSWLHYYFMTTLFKTPEPTLLAAVVGLGVLITGIRRRMVEPRVISMFLFLGIPAGVCFASVSLQGGFNHHHRYVLMIYPFIFALAAYIASSVGVNLLRFRIPFCGPKKRRIAVPLATTLLALTTLSSLRVHPHYTSYFNTISGGPENGWRLLGFSNIDWGQDILEVDNWLKENLDKRPVVMDLNYLGMNGALFDVPTLYPPQLPTGASIDQVRGQLTETQWWVISVKRLYNYPRHDGLQYLQQIEPVEKIAYAYHVYRMDPLPVPGHLSDKPSYQSDNR